MKMFQKAITLPQKKRGFHLITSDISRAIGNELNIQQGLCHVFIKHTSASLTINENADPTVRKDFETFFNKTVKEHDHDYLHDTEGSDDMPAHLKASLLGSLVTIPVTNGRLALGSWQGIYLCEHRNYGGEREIVISIWGE
jgi:secondary thiamine-phosphate synthase enzyme